jgi:hypothetical protein
MDMGIDLIVMASSKVASPIIGGYKYNQKGNRWQKQTDPYLLYMKSKDTIMVVVEDGKRN